MNARASENYLAISRSSNASKSVEIFWAEIYWGQLFLGPNLVSFNRAVIPYEILTLTTLNATIVALSYLATAANRDYCRFYTCVLMVDPETHGKFGGF